VNRKNNGKKTMIDFSLSEDQKQFRELAREFAKNEIRPAAAQLDEQEKFPAEVCRKGWELGLMNVHVPKEHGASASACWKNL
jgi:alkylation response protein AidB-like acyl-CoA dehydrogenase